MKHIKELETIGFKPTAKKQFYTYKKDGYYIIAQSLVGGKLGLLASVKSDNALISYLDKLTIHDENIVRAYYDDYECGIVVKMRKSAEEIDALLNDLVAYFMSSGSKQVCHGCHEVKKISPVHIHGDIDLLCEECILKKETEEVKPEYKKGMLGAVIACIIPAVIWAFTHRLGYVVSATGILFGLCSYLGYKRSGHKMSKKGWLLTFFAAALMMHVGELFAMGFAIQAAFASSSTATIGYWQAFVLLPAFLSDPEVIGVTLAYFAYTYVFIFITYLLIYFLHERKM